MQDLYNIMLAMKSDNDDVIKGVMFCTRHRRNMHDRFSHAGLV
jgi:hypothetical protein